MEQNYKRELLDTYNKSAQELAEYFASIGSRAEDIEIAIRLASGQNPEVLEIGCGDGRDAKEIIKHTTRYTGFDIAEELIKIARQKVPQAKFEVADALGYKFPANIDIIFAFASLLHFNQQELADVLTNAHKALRPKGIFYISLKYAPRYTERYKEDRFGRRLFFFYNPSLIKKVAGKKYRVVHSTRSRIGHTDWFEMALQKQW